MKNERLSKNNFNFKWSQICNKIFLPIADAAKNNNFEVDLFIPKKTTDLTFF